MELLLAVLILGIIAVPLTSAVIVGLKTSDKTSTRLTDGNSADFVAAYFARDVRNSLGINQNATTCSGAAGGKLTVDAGGGTSISYSSPTGSTLVRTECPSSGAARAKTLASALDPSQPPLVTASPNAASWRTVKLDLHAKSGYDFHLRVTKRTS
jgi:hypothetical protein